MPRCPFCKGEVGEDLLRYGGHCPHCLNEIPGEESATDPGAAARARAEQEARVAAARHKRRNMILGAVSFVLVLGGVGAYVALHEEPVPLVLDDGDVYIAPASSHHSTVLEQQAAAEKAKAEAEAEAKRREAARRAAANGGDPGPQDLASAGPGLASPTSSGTTAGLPEAMPTSSSSTSLGSMGIDLKARGPTAKQMEGLVLSSDNDVKAMVKTVVEAGYKQLQQCYESRLKENPTLSGRWEVTFVIAKEGKVDSAEALGKTVKDRTFEQCMVSNVKQWRFTPISKPFEITKAFVFSP